MLYVLGHQYPDSDCICTSLVVTDWLNAQGMAAKCFSLGPLKSETRFLLDYANVPAPTLLTESLNGKSVFLVDVESSGNIPSGIEPSQIRGCLNRHQLVPNLVLDDGMMMTGQVGSCATLLFNQLYPAYSFAEAQACLLLGAILSETRELTSAQTTDEDRDAVYLIERLAHVDREALASAMLAHKQDHSSLSLTELLRADERIYCIAQKRIAICQLHVADDDELRAESRTLYKIMRERLLQNHINGYVLIIACLDRNRSTLLFVGDGRVPQGMRKLPRVVNNKRKVLSWLINHLELEAS